MHLESRTPCDFSVLISLRFLMHFCVLFTVLLHWSVFVELLNIGEHLQLHNCDCKTDYWCTETAMLHFECFFFDAPPCYYVRLLFGVWLWSWIQTLALFCMYWVRKSDVL